MEPRPSILKAMIVLQFIFIAYDLFAPFYSPIFQTFTTMDFLIAYMTAVLDFIILIGFLRGSRWIWFFSLVYGGVSVLAYAFAFVANPVVLTLLMILLRVVLLVLLRGKQVRKYFNVSKFTRLGGKSPRV
jgi:hypothetical protein